MRSSARRSQQGFALVLAMLTLMLLTFLGLTLATTSSTELQIATNWRWSQQALWNAEAALEGGKAMLRTMNWSLILPPARTGGGTGCVATGNAALKCWYAQDPTVVTFTPPAPYTRQDKNMNASRNFEAKECDRRGAGVGYGVVLDDGGANAPYQNMDTILGESLNGNSTIWVRRRIVVNDDASFSDYAADANSLMLTAEGTAPYVRAATQVAGGIGAANRAVRFLEVQLSTSLNTPCGTRGGQVGGGPEGSNFSPCDPITGDAVGRSLTGSAKTDTGAE